MAEDRKSHSPVPANQEAMQSVPVGLEQVLFVAACDPVFRQALLRDRDRAVADRDLVLMDTEEAMLQAIPAAQLEGMIARIDTSSANLHRRHFMRAVAATFVGLAAGSSLTGCGTEEPEVHTDMPRDYQPKPEHVKQFDSIKKAIAKQAEKEKVAPPADKPDASAQAAEPEEAKPTGPPQEKKPPKKTKGASPKVKIKKKSIGPKPAGILSEKP